MRLLQQGNVLIDKCCLLFCCSESPNSQTGSWQVTLLLATGTRTTDHHQRHTQHIPHCQCSHDHRMSAPPAPIRPVAEFHRSVWCQISTTMEMLTLNTACTGKGIPWLLMVVLSHRMCKWKFKTLTDVCYSAKWVSDWVSKRVFLYKS